MLRDWLCRTFHQIAPGYHHGQYGETLESCLTCGRSLEAKNQYPPALPPLPVIKHYTPEKPLLGVDRAACEEELEKMRRK